MFVEQADNTVKISWRARPGCDVSQVAVRFGGGGHKVASGAMIAGELDAVCAEVLAATRSILNDH
jgi:phosphoesterase RecJ-like protein